MVIKFLVSFTVILLLSGCVATSKVATSIDHKQLFSDESFKKPAVLARSSDIYFLTQEQKVILNTLVKPSTRQSFTRQLIDNLLQSNYSAFDYDNSFTRTASQTFDSKEGNCLSMVILSVAMAKHFDIKYRIFDVKTAPIWDRNGGLFLVNGHINIQLENTNYNSQHSVYEFLQSRYLTLDFLPTQTRRSLAKKQIGESELAGMYFVNLAADAMVKKDWNSAYWLLKESIVHAPNVGAAWNSLAVLYRHNGYDKLAERVYKYALSLSPEDTNVVANLAILLSAQGRYQELFEYQRQIDLAELKNPYRYYDQGREAYVVNDFYRALRLYKKAIKLSPHVDQFYFGLYQTYMALDKQHLAIKNLKIAQEKSSRLNDRLRYRSKLALLTNN